MNRILFASVVLGSVANCQIRFPLDKVAEEEKTTTATTTFVTSGRQRSNSENDIVLLTTPFTTPRTTTTTTTTKTLIEEFPGPRSAANVGQFARGSFSGNDDYKVVFTFLFSFRKESKL